MKSALKGRRLRRSATAVTIAAATLILAGCGERPLSTFGNESELATDLSNMLWGLLIVCGIVFVLVQGAVIYMAYKFRVDESEDEDDVYPDDEFPEQVHGNTRLEIGWTILPTLIMAVVAFFTLTLYFQLDDVEAVDDRRIERVDVVGQQWWWEFQYYLTDDALAALGQSPTMPGPHIVTAGEMPLVIDEEVGLEVMSRDVIHSFWIPALNGKRDAVPGRSNPWTIETLSEGRFPGECTEFCGLSHAYMEKWVIGLTPEDWDDWARNQMQDANVPEEGSDAAAGWEVFANQCASCHVVNGLTRLGSGGGIADDDFRIYDGANRLIDRQTQVSGAAPNLTHLMTRSTFAGGIFELYQRPDEVYSTVALGPEYDEEARRYVLDDDGNEIPAPRPPLNLGDLEAWIRNAPEMKANAWDSPGGQRGMTPFTALSDEDLDHLVAFLMTLD